MWSPSGVVKRHNVARASLRDPRMRRQGRRGGGSTRGCRGSTTLFGIPTPLPDSPLRSRGKENKDRQEGTETFSHTSYTPAGSADSAWLRFRRGQFGVRVRSWARNWVRFSTTRDSGMNAGIEPFDRGELHPRVARPRDLRHCFDFMTLSVSKAETRIGASLEPGYETRHEMGITPSLVSC